MAQRRRVRAGQEADGSAQVGDIRVLARVLALRFAKAYDHFDRLGFLVGAGFSQSEVAEMLNMNPTSVRTGLHRIRKASGQTKKGSRKVNRTKKD